MTDCIFCKIANKEIPATVIHETDQVIAFSDINPKAPVHTLIAPKKHVERLDQLEDRDTAAELVLVINRLVAKQRLENGYRLISNNGPDGHQEVGHVHFHLLGGKDLGSPALAKQH